MMYNYHMCLKAFILELQQLVIDQCSVMRSAVRQPDPQSVTVLFWDNRFNYRVQVFRDDYLGQCLFVHGHEREPASMASFRGDLNEASANHLAFATIRQHAAYKSYEL